MSAKPGADNVRSAHRDPEELQREADAIRADLDRTLNALERKLSPKRLWDRSVSYVQANGPDILQKIGATVSRHPLPFLAASAGLLVFAAARRQSRRRRWYEGPSAAPRRGDFDRASQSFSSGLSRANRTATQFKAHAGETFDRTREHTAELGRQASDAIKDQPLVYGAIALTIGAIIGSILPATQLERDVVARVRDAGKSLLDEVKGDDVTPASAPPPTSH